MKGFPSPTTLSPGCVRWRFSSLLEYEAERDGSPRPNVAPNDERYLRDVEVARRYGVTRPTVWRWSKPARVRQANACRAEVSHHE